MIKVLGIFLMFLILYGLLLLSDFASASSVQSQQALALRVGTMGILVLAVAPVIITGGIDLSIGSVMVLSAISYILIMKYIPGFSPYPAALVILVGASFIGLLQGLLITKCRLQPFLATLCGLFIARGMARWITRMVTGSTGTVPVSGTPYEMSSIDFLVKGLYFGLPWIAIILLAAVCVVLIILGKVLHQLKVDQRRMIFAVGVGVGIFALFNVLLQIFQVGVPWPLILMLGIATLLGVILHASVYGRYLYAIGSNEQAARYSGIATDRYKTMAYVWCSMLVAVGGMLFIMENGGANPANDGNFYELYAITGAVLGGCSLRGGEGMVIGMVLGAAILPLLKNVILFAGVPDDVEFAVVGFALLLGTIVDETLKRRSAARL